MRDVGFGNSDFTLAVCIANRPELGCCSQQTVLRPLVEGEVQQIVSQTSNHWRKVFNLYAKFMYQLGVLQATACPDWQTYRDRQLFQPGCTGALLFSPPNLNREDIVHIVAGKTYASQLPLPPLQWLDARFAINSERKLIVSPYLDYRQLSNKRIEQLVMLVESMRGKVDD